MANDLYSLLNMNKTEDDEDTLKKKNISSMESAPVDENTDWNKAAQEAWDANEREKAIRASSGVAATSIEANNRGIETPQVAQSGGSESADEIANYGTPINVSGNHTAGGSPAPMVDTKAAQSVQKTYTADTNPESKSKGDESLLPWLATLAPYAIEGIFGGGKYMGSAGYGSAEGGKIIRELDKQRADRDVASMKVTNQLTKALNDLGFKREKLASDKDTQEDRTAIMQQNADTSKAKQAEGNYVFVKSVDANGNPVFTAMDKKTANVLPTDTKVYVPPQKQNAIGQRSKDVAQRELSKRLEKIYPSLQNAQDYQQNYRDLNSFDPRYINLSDTQLPPAMQSERQAVRRMISSYLTESIGTAQTDGELARALSGIGIAATPGTIAEMKQNPALFADRFLTTSSRDAIRRSLDSIAQRTTGKLKVITSGYDPATVQSVLTGSGVKDIPWDKYTPKSKESASKGKETIDQKIERIKKQMAEEKKAKGK